MAQLQTDINGENPLLNAGVPRELARTMLEDGLLDDAILAKLVDAFSGNILIYTASDAAKAARDLHEATLNARRHLTDKKAGKQVRNDALENYLFDPGSRRKLLEAYEERKKIVDNLHSERVANLEREAYALLPPPLPASVSSQHAEDNTAEAHATVDQDTSNDNGAATPTSVVFSPDQLRGRTIKLYSAPSEISTTCSSGQTEHEELRSNAFKYIERENFRIGWKLLAEWADANIEHVKLMKVGRTGALSEQRLGTTRKPRPNCRIVGVLKKDKDRRIEDHDTMHSDTIPALLHRAIQLSAELAGRGDTLTDTTARATLDLSDARYPPHAFSIIEPRLTSKVETGRLLVCYTHERRTGTGYFTIEGRIDAIE